MATNPPGPADESGRPQRSSATAQLVTRLRDVGCVFAEEEADLLWAATDDPDEREQLVRRRLRGEPLEQVLGWVEFGGLRLEVAPGVFVPRQRTLAMTDVALHLLKPGDLVLDLCCGVGAVAAVLADRTTGVRLLAADVDPVATRCAAHNLAPDLAPDLAHGLAQVFTGDLFEAVPTEHRGHLDLITANVPYVPTARIALMPPEARDHEPRVALDGGVDGLDVARRVLVGATQWLRPGGSLLIEVDADQVAAATATAREQGLSARSVWDAERETTVLIARRPHARPSTRRPAPPV